MKKMKKLDLQHLKELDIQKAPGFDVISSSYFKSKFLPPVLVR